MAATMPSYFFTLPIIELILQQHKILNLKDKKVDKKAKAQGWRSGLKIWMHTTKIICVLLCAFLRTAFLRSDFYLAQFIYFFLRLFR
jgi:hypothetical protein